MNTITLNNGLQMPQLGLGTFNVPDDETAKEAVKAALAAGFRSIDTAHAYNDERGVGQGIRESGVPRQDIWLTSKLWPSEYGPGKTLSAIEKMLKRLDTDYLDLLFVHQPVGDFAGAWKEMETAVAQGKVRSLGISNFDGYGFEEIMQAVTIKPAVLQVECHPYHQQTEMRKKIAPYGMVLESWFPLGGGVGNETLFSDPVIAAIAKAHDKTAAQVLLRWQIQEGFIAIPGSINPAHIQEDIHIDDFTLTDGEMAQLRALDGKGRFFNMTYEEVKEFVSSIVLTD